MNEYPGTNFHDLNLDWLLDQMKQLREEWAEFLEEWAEFRSHYPVYETPEDITEPVEVEIAPGDD